MATLTLQNTRVVSGRTITWTAASVGGDRVPIGADVFLAIRNASASSVTVTIDATGTAFNAQPIPDTTRAVLAGTDVLIPISDSQYRAVSDGLAAVTYSAVASVTVAALSV